MINKLLTAAGTSIDAFMANAVVEKLEAIERIDRLATIAERRLNDALYQIEQRRTVLGATLQQTVQEIEDAKFKVIDATPANGKKAS
jgi:hypothetical protein